MNAPHIIKVEGGKALQITAAKGEVKIAATMFGARIAGMAATPEQVKETILALSAAQAECGGVRCHDGDACKAGQVPCPMPWACGVRE